MTATYRDSTHAIHRNQCSRNIHASASAASASFKSLCNTFQPNQTRFMFERPAFRNQEYGGVLISIDPVPMINVITQLINRGCMDGYQAGLAKFGVFHNEVRRIVEANVMRTQPQRFSYSQSRAGKQPEQHLACMASQ